MWCCCSTLELASKVYVSLGGFTGGSPGTKRPSLTNVSFSEGEKEVRDRDSQMRKRVMIGNMND
jgi:hypothetical protein